MTEALDAAVRAAHHVITTEPCMYCFDNPCSGIDGCGCAQAFARAALRAALPAEPTPEAIEAMMRDMMIGDPLWVRPGAVEAMSRRAYRALREFILGELGEDA